MAPIRPSIMSDGATMSAAGLGLHEAWRTSTVDRLVVDDDRRRA